MTHKITTTIEPEREPYEVDDAEYLDLKRNGLIATEVDEDDEPADLAALASLRPETPLRSRTKPTKE